MEREISLSTYYYKYLKYKKKYLEIGYLENSNITGNYRYHLLYPVTTTNEVFISIINILGVN